MRAVADPDFIFPEGPAPEGVGAAFSLRTGGASRGRFTSFNLGAHVGDEPESVATNRARLAAARTVARGGSAVEEKLPLLLQRTPYGKRGSSLVESVGPSLFLDGLGIVAPYQLKDAIAFTMLVLVLIFRPTGLLGERLAVKKA